MCSDAGPRHTHQSDTQQRPPSPPSPSRPSARDHGRKPSQCGGCMPLRAFLPIPDSGVLRVIEPTPLKGPSFPNQREPSAARTVPGVPHQVPPEQAICSPSSSSATQTNAVSRSRTIVSVAISVDHVRWKKGWNKSPGSVHPSVSSLLLRWTQGMVGRKQDVTHDFAGDGIGPYQQCRLIRARIDRYVLI